MKKHYPKKTFLVLVTTRTYSIKLIANLRAQIDSGDPGLSFGYLTILLASIVIEIIAIFCENSPILRKKIELFFTPCDLKFDLIKKRPKYFLELATAYPTPFTACRYLSKFSSTLGGGRGGHPPPPPAVRRWLRPPAVRGL